MGLSDQKRWSFYLLEERWSDTTHGDQDDSIQRIFRCVSKCTIRAANTGS